MALLRDLEVRLGKPTECLGVAALLLVLVDPSVKRLASLGRGAGKSREAPTWKLSLNVPLEIDA